MRICVLTTVAHGVGGMQRHTHELVRGLVDAGHDVEVVAPAHPSLAGDAYGARWRLLDAPPDFVDRVWQARSAAEVERAHAERPFDVVHGEGSAALGLVRRGLHRRIPLVVEFHGNYL